MGPTATFKGFCVVGTAEGRLSGKLQCLKALTFLVGHLRLLLLHYCRYLIGGLSSTTRP